MTERESLLDARDCPLCRGASTLDPDPDCSVCHGEGQIEMTPYGAECERLQVFYRQMGEALADAEVMAGRLIRRVEVLGN